MQGYDRLPETIGGYRIVRRIAREATVDVLLARAEGARGEERTVVLKLVSPTFRGDPMFEQTFVRETQAIAQLDHPSIVRLYDVFSAPDIKAMVLEHVDGLSLSELRSGLLVRGETLPDVAAYAVAASIFSALAAAHAARDPQTGNLLPIVHRDVHPGQILVASDGSVKLGGFGLERITGVRGDARTGEARGYLPPEKARGESVTIRSDVYAAMLVVWELLARRRAVRDDALPEQELVRALAQPTIVSLEVLRPELPALVRSIVARGLEPQVDRRTVTAEEAANIFRSAGPPEEGRQLLAQAVARALGAVSEPPRAPEPSLPRFASSPELPPQPKAPSSSPPSMDRRGPPRPNPRRMWGSSPTLTPASGVVPPSSLRSGSIPDARFSQDRQPLSVDEARSSRPELQERSPLSSTLASGDAPDAQRAARPGTRTVAGGFDVSSLKPLLDSSPSPGEVAPPATTRGAPAPPPAPLGSPPLAQELLPAADPFTIPAPPPGEALPGMAVPLATAPTVMAEMSPFAAAGNSPAPFAPPDAAPAPTAKAEGGEPFWSSPPPPAAPAAQRGSRKKSRSSLMALAIGLFFVATAVGAGGFVWLFKRRGPPQHAGTTAAATSAIVLPPASAAPSASVSVHAVSRASATASAAPVPPPAASSAAPAPSAKPSAAPVAIAVSALPEASAKPAAVASAHAAESAPAVKSGEGVVRLDKRSAGHRVYVDNHVVGEGEGPYTVACGAHTVKVGSHGKPQKIDVPCGGEVAVSTK